MEKEYYIGLDVFLTDNKSVFAKNKKEAIKKAIENSEYNDGGSDFTVREVEEIQTKGQLFTK